MAGLDRSSKDFIETLYSQPPPSDEDLPKLAIQIQNLVGKHPRRGQTLCLWHLLYGRQDGLFQAANSYGKSLIWQCAPIIGAGISLMLSPLNMLSEDQIAALPVGSRGLALTAQNNNEETYKGIARGDYTHAKYAFGYFWSSLPSTWQKR